MLQWHYVVGEVGESDTYDVSKAPLKYKVQLLDEV